MPAIGWICPDQQQIKFEECFRVCRMGSRCITLPTLKRMARQRYKVIWQCPSCDQEITTLDEIPHSHQCKCQTAMKLVYKPSTTELINGTRLSLLKLTTNYVLDPQKQAFALLGTKHHEKLEDAEFLMEEKFEDETLTGIPDYFDDQEHTLYDFKSSGSFKVAKALGIVCRKERDPSGALYQKAGSYKVDGVTVKFKTGDPKMINIWETNPAKVDMQDWVLQLNRYRLFLEETGFTVKEMKIQATVRDGGLQIATQRGLNRNIYLIPVPRMPDNDVRNYFSDKATALHEALRTGYAPKCNSEETWQGKRCKEYCEVAEACKAVDMAVTATNNGSFSFHIVDGE